MVMKHEEVTKHTTRWNTLRPRILFCVFQKRVIEGKIGLLLTKQRFCLCQIALEPSKHHHHHTHATIDSIDLLSTREMNDSLR